MIIRMSRSGGATRRGGRRSVTMRNVDRLNEDLNSSESTLFFPNNDPMIPYSCANTRASRRVSCPVRNFWQNSRTDAGEVRSHCSAKMCSFSVLARTASTMSVVDSSSTGLCVRAMMCAPLFARASRRVRPVEVNPP